MKAVVSAGSTAKPWYRGGGRRLRPWLLLLAVIVAAGGYLAYDRFFKPQPVATPTTQQVAVTRGSVVSTVDATGSVIPLSTSELAFGSSGRLTELKASVGQTVKKGDVLAQLDTTDLKLEVLKAEAQLASAESSLAKLEAGSTAAELAQARAQLKSAQANLADLRAGPTAAEQRSAEASVVSARASLQKAEQDLADLKAGPSEDEITKAKVAIEKAKITVQNAQAAYDKIAWKANAGATQEAMTLWQATTDYQAAEVAYNEAVAGPTATELSVAESSVESARAQLASAEDKLETLKAGATEAEVASAEASLMQAQASLEDKLNPTTAAEIQAARASVEQAKVAVESAKANLGKAAIVAPFDGAVATVSGSVGQTVTGTVVTLLDLSAPQVQISLPETDVAKVEAGQSATITFEALNGAQLTGKVLAISPKATVSSGVATYATTISIDPAPRLSQTPRDPAAAGAQTPAAGGASGQGRGGGTGQGARAGAQPQAGANQMLYQAADISKVKAGMTASVSIEYLRKDNVLLVPNRAVKSQGRNRVVEVMVDGKSETRTVTVGAADDTNTEILSGLQEGDQVVITSTTTSTSSATSGNVRIQQGGIPGGGFPGGGPVVVPMR